MHTRAPGSQKGFGPGRLHAPTLSPPFPHASVYHGFPGLAALFSVVSVCGGGGGEDDGVLAPCSQYSGGDEQVLSELYPGSHTQRTSVPAGQGSERGSLGRGACILQMGRMRRLCVQRQVESGLCNHLTNSTF